MVAIVEGSTVQRAAGSTRMMLAGSPGFERAALVREPADRGRRGGGDPGKVRPAHQAGLDHGVLDHGQRGFQPGHAHGRLRPLAFLVLAGVRGVVGADDVDGAVGQGRRAGPAHPRRCAAAG